MAERLSDEQVKAIIKQIESIQSEMEPLIPRVRFPNDSRTNELILDMAHIETYKDALRAVIGEITPEIQLLSEEGRVHVFNTNRQG